MTESPQEMHGVPPEEDIDAADFGARLDEDPHDVPNAPNRDPRDSAGSSVVPPEQPDDRADTTP